MISYRIKRVGEDVVLSVWENGFEQSVKMPEQVFMDIVEDVEQMPEVHGYPVALDVEGDRVELPYEELLKLRSTLRIQSLPN